LVLGEGGAVIRMRAAVLAVVWHVVQLTRSYAAVAFDTALNRPGDEFHECRVISGSPARLMTRQTR
jgi:hypothetical protein